MPEEGVGTVSTEFDSVCPLDASICRHWKASLSLDLGDDVESHRRLMLRRGQAPTGSATSHRGDAVENTISSVERRLRKKLSQRISIWMKENIALIGNVCAADTDSLDLSVRIFR